MTKARLDAVAAVVVGAVGFAYRFLAHTSFSNDQFVHLARAQAWLSGDWPIRDYTETGAILTVGASAAAQALFGESLLPELLLSTVALGAGAAVTCWAVTRLTGNRALGVFAAVLQILVFPRLYSYPKILLYPVGLVLLRRYSDRPTVARLVAATAWVAVAFLFRHDHGGYAALATVLTLVIVHWHEGIAHAARKVAAFAGILVLCLMPFLVYVQANLGIWSYLRLGLLTYQGEAGRTRTTRPSFRIEGGSLLVRHPPDAGDLPRIHIRWSMSVDDASREMHEKAVPLLYPEHLDERTWRYRVEWKATDALRQLLDGSAVEDVDGVDRRTLEFTTRRSVWRSMLDTLHLSGLGPGPPITSLSGNAGPLLFYSAWILPFAALLLWSRNRARERALIAVLCVLAFVCTAGFQRDEPSIRTPDVFGTYPILFAWVLAELLALSTRHVMFHVLAGVLAITIFISVAALGRAGEMLTRTEVFEGPAAVVDRAATIARSARVWPWSAHWPGDNEWRLARYVHDCTAPGDRLLVTWFAPEFYVFSRRPFAGRETVLMPVYRTPATYEAAVLESWKQQHVPIVLVEEGSYRSFAATYPDLAGHLSSRYRRMASMPSGADTIDVYAEQDRIANGRDAESGWECFAPRR